MSTICDTFHFAIGPYCAVAASLSSHHASRAASSAALSGKKLRAVGDDGGTFTGRWSSPAPAGTPRRAGPLGGLYYSDHSFEGQATYDGIPFEVTGGWVRTHSQGGIALAIVEHCE